MLELNMELAIHLSAGASSLSSESACAIYDHVTMGLPMPTTHMYMRMRGRGPVSTENIAGVVNVSIERHWR